MIRALCVLLGVFAIVSSLPSPDQIVPETKLVSASHPCQEVCTPGGKMCTEDDAEKTECQACKQCILAQPDCDACATTFKDNGGCKLIKAGEDVSEKIPDGCAPCAYQASRICGVERADSCDQVCHEGCDSRADAHKPECRACAKCHGVVLEKFGHCIKCINGRLDHFHELYKSCRDKRECSKEEFKTAEDFCNKQSFKAEEYAHVFPPARRDRMLGEITRFNAELEKLWTDFQACKEDRAKCDLDKYDEDLEVCKSSNEAMAPKDQIELLQEMWGGGARC